MNEGFAIALACSAALSGWLLSAIIRTAARRGVRDGLRAAAGDDSGSTPRDDDSGQAPREGEQLKRQPQPDRSTGSWWSRGLYAGGRERRR